MLLLIILVLPVLLVLHRAVSEPELFETWPRSTLALREWDGKGLPDDQVVKLVARDMAASFRDGTITRVANRLNYTEVGARGLIINTAKRLDPEAPTNLLALRAIDPRWGKPEIWAAMHQASGPYSAFYLLSAVDLRSTSNGQLSWAEPEQAVFVAVLVRTLGISVLVTILCLILGCPLSYYLATASEKTARKLLLIVLLPYWTSVLARTTAWAVLLQTNGPINDMLLGLGLVEKPLALIYNRTGVIVAMVHVLLPFMVLPAYGVMRRIPADTLLAARSLGASFPIAMIRIYLPQCAPGIIAGAIVVFTLALGYYITPALLGGGGDQMISAFIANYVNATLNWGMAGALSVVLITTTMLLLLAAGMLGKSMWKVAR